MEENIFTNTSGDTLTVQQYGDTFQRSEHIEPERLLLAAILQDAVEEYRKYSRANNAKGKRRFSEAEEWIMYDGNDWIFSFDNVCNSLGLDPEYIRHRVCETQGKPTKEEKPLHRARMRRWAA